VARILAKPVDELRGTDITEHALDALAASRVREIHIVGRRGPAQAKFTSKELRELGELTGCTVQVSADDLRLGASCREELADKRNHVAAKNLQIFQSWTGSRAERAGKRIVFHFLKMPVLLQGRERLEAVALERGVLCGAPFAQTVAGGGSVDSLSCGLLFRSIGYRGRPLNGVPFDAKQGVLPHEGGRIGDCAGVYAAGWIKRGPSGIIGTNRADAVATVASLVSDLPRMGPALKPGGAELRTRGTRIVGYEDWRRLDAIEIERGARAGKPREKMTRIDEMLAALQ
jgi:ferredoxin--NADP+ reductase